jgi:hypothetical protein
MTEPETQNAQPQAVPPQAAQAQAVQPQAAQTQTTSARLLQPKPRRSCLLPQLQVAGTTPVRSCDRQQR